MATVSRQDVLSVEKRLREFSTTLPEQERNVLGWLVSRARHASTAGLVDDDLDADSADQDLASALGFSEEFGDLTISWRKTSWE